MTSSDSQASMLDLQQIAAAFAVERQILAPGLSPSVAESLNWSIEAKDKIAAGLLLCLSLVSRQGSSSADVKIERLDRIYPTGRNQGLIDFKLVCVLSVQLQVHLGICVLPSLDLQILNQACTRLLVYKDFGLDRLCLLGDSNLMTNISQLPACLPKLLSTDIGGHFIPLKFPDLLTILTVLSVFQHKHQHGVTNELICTYLQQAELLTKNELINSILTIART
jgi:hypothetical protein